MTSSTHKNVPLGAAQLVGLFADIALKADLILPVDRPYTVNMLLDALDLDAPQAYEPFFQEGGRLTDVARLLTDEAVRKGLCEDGAEARGHFMDRLFGFITPSPYETRRFFFELFSHDPRRATDWFYSVQTHNNYIKSEDVMKNIRFDSLTPAGLLNITINLSKPEKDPRDIAKALKAPVSGYPACLLCVDNVGYRGRPGHPSRQNLRLIPLSLGGELWHMQYSPYVYYDEHCIVLKNEHSPMVINRASFTKLFDFVDQFPHYFIGSNADLPIVGGSILSHEHFQGGRARFPMEYAKERDTVDVGDPEIAAHILDWPMSCLRLTGTDRDKLIELADRLLQSWRGYSDEGLGIWAHTDQPHNTVTPVLRKDEDGSYRLYLLLRNNRTSLEHPLGIFHPHQDKHAVKKENIGLIEAMGLFILPGRLLNEVTALADSLTKGEQLADDHPQKLLYDKARAGLNALPDQNGAFKALQDALGDTCYRVLVDTGVFKQDAAGHEGFKRFMTTFLKDKTP